MTREEALALYHPIYGTLVNAMKLFQ